MKSFFRIDAEKVPRQVVEDFSAIKENVPEELGSVDSIFGSSALFVPFYVTPYAQNVNPADDPDEDSGWIAAVNVFKMLDKNLAKPHFSHTLILSDAGMGKTSLMVILKLAHLNKLVDQSIRLELLKLGRGSADDIKALKDPQNTILLLDALDEEPSAWSERFYDRLQELLQLTKNFRKVLITCRTQFFPNQLEEDGKGPGMVVLHGFPCAKVFLSPFDDAQVGEYLLRRFPDEDSRSKAQVIVSKMRSLKFRPMLLSYIDWLLGHDGEYENAYELYAALVDEWLNREIRKGVVTDKNLLTETCVAVANEIYRTGERIISRARLEEIYANIPSLVHLPEMTVEGRTLLQRTSHGGYKFAHYSILEFFVARSLILQPDAIRTSDQVKLFLLDNLRAGNLRRIRSLDLSQVTLNKIQIRGIEAQGAVLAGATIGDSSLTHGAFNRSSLIGATIVGSELRESNFSDAQFKNAKFIDCDLQKAKFSGVSFKDVSFVRVNFVEADFAGASFAGGVFDSCNLDALQLEGHSLSDCHFSGCGSRSATFVDVSFEHGTFSFHKFISCSFERTLGTDSRFVKCSFEGGTIVACDWTRAQFEGSTFIGMEIEHSVFAGASFQQTQFRNCRFTNCDLLDVDMSSAVLTNVKFAKSRFRRGILSGASFGEVDMSGIDLSNCKAAGVVFAESVLIESDFTDGFLKGAKFDRCDASFAKFVRVDAEGGSFAGSVMKHANCEDANFAS